MYKKLKKPILFILGALLLFLLFSQTTLGKRVLLEANVIEAIRNFFAGNPELHACDYKDGTILLIKPLATGVGEGRYEAGDIIEIKDGIALCERFGNGDFLGRKEKTRALVVYYPAKLTDEQKRELVESEYETDTEVRLQDPKEVGLQRENGEAPLKLLKRRQVGVDYTKFLNDNEVLKIRSFEGLNRIPEIDLSPIIEKSPDQKSVVQIPKHLARIENFRDGINKIVRKIIPFAFAQTGGTNTICTSGCDYTTLNDWEGLEQGILTSPAIAQITEGFQDTTAVTILGWDTTASNYIYIYTTPAARHSGKWDAGKYRLELTMTSAYSNLLSIYEEYVRIDGIQIEGSTGAGVTVLRDLMASINNVNSDIRISNNIITVGTIVSGYMIGMALGDYNGSFNYSVWNNIVYDPTHTASGYGISISSGTGTKNSYVYNNTVVNWWTGINGANTTAINNIVKGSGDTTAYTGTFTGSDYNATDGTDTGDGGPNSLRSQTFTFVSEVAGTEDYHLQSTDTGALNNGSGATPKGLFTDDIDGQTRPATDLDWDIGADELLYCGDGTCNGSETCVSCSADCGTCQVILKPGVILKRNVIFGRPAPPTVQTDSCTGDLLFSWHMENTDVTLGGIAGGVNNGCSLGDTTATAVSAAVINTDLYKDGVASGDFPTASDYFTFSVTDAGNGDGDIIKPANAGTVDFWVYFDALVQYTRPFDVTIDSNNLLRIWLPDTTQLKASLFKGGLVVGSPVTTLPGNLQTGIWYHVTLKWGSGTCEGVGSKTVCLCVDTSDGTTNCGSGDGTGTWVGSITTLYIGNHETVAGDLHIDNIKIYSSWQ